jgi:hypothetical protein
VKEVPSLELTSVPFRCNIPFRYTKNFPETNALDGENIVSDPSTCEDKSSSTSGIGAAENVCE